VARLFAFAKNAPLLAVADTGVRQTRIRTKAPKSGGCAITPLKINMKTA
jgi:hypothetical protein